MLADDRHEVGRILLVYFALNRAMVALAVSWSSARGWWAVLREDWLYLARLEVDAASLMLVPLMVIGFTAIGYPGVLLFYAPLVAFVDRAVSEGFIKPAHRGIVVSDADPVALLAKLERANVPDLPKWIKRDEA